jgi:hypothetical protein
MPDEFYARYRDRTHAELYEMLMAGSPEQVERMRAAWVTLEGTASTFAATLRGHLDQLKQGWDSAAGREFDLRVGLIATYAQTLTEEFAAIHTGLGAMAGALAQAQAAAEHPDATAGNDGASSAAAQGAAAGSVLGPGGALVGGVVGGTLGHQRDRADQAAAKERMVQLVAGLAADYRVADYQIWPATVPSAPGDMPGARPGASATTTPAATGPALNSDTKPVKETSGHHGPKGEHGGPGTAPTSPASTPLSVTTTATSTAVPAAVATGVSVAAVANPTITPSGHSGGTGSSSHGPTNDLVWNGSQQDNSAGTTWGHHGWDDDGLGRPDAAPDKVDIGSTMDSDGVIRGGYDFAHVPGDPGHSVLAGSGSSDDGRGNAPPPPPPAAMGTIAPQPAATGVGASVPGGGGGGGGGGYHNPGTLGGGYSTPGTVGGAGTTGYTTSLAAAGGGGGQPGVPGSGLAGGHAMTGGSGTALTTGGFGPDAGQRPADDRSWMNEGRLRWHDDEEGPPAE